jgi:glycosyltransferase involved in cell wall biosynthesis
VVTDGLTGFVVPVDAVALRDALERLEADREIARAMGTRARETALARYSHERMVDAYLALYDQARR